MATKSFSYNTTGSSAVAARHQLHNQLRLRRQKALADALAGVAATLISLWTFYPMDVLKTKLQAGTNPKQLWKGLFRGLPLKTLHSAFSSFTYWYLYSSIVSWWSARNNNNMSTAARLTLSAIAAMLNTFLTLPLDVLASQHQASSHHDDDDDDDEHHQHEEQEEDMETLQETSSTSSEEEQQHDLHLKDNTIHQQQQMEQVWTQLESSEEKPPDLLVEDVNNRSGDVFYDSCSEPCEVDDEDSKENKKDDRAQQVMKTNNQHYHPATNKKVTLTLSSFCQDQLVRLDSVISISSASKFNNKTTMDNILSLWKGLFPSLLLCTNPSINFTVFDCTKNYILQSRTNHLTMSEAFLLGLFAKFCATMATYPLIRAKVMLMVTSRNSMLMTLMENYRRGGVQGWYKGCSIQLLHTVLKSALLMMVKERIAVTTHRLLVPHPQPTTHHNATTTGRPSNR